MYVEKKERRKFMILFFAIPFLLGIGVDLYVPSLPFIANYFSVKPSLVKFSISFYMLGYGLGQIFLGILSDVFGRKKVLLSGSIFFIIFSFLAAFSKDIYFFNFFRFLQGISVAAMGVVIRAIAKDSFSGIDLNRIFSYIAASWALGPIIGPFIGGYFQQYINWQMNFYFFAIYGLFIMIYSFFIKETNLCLHEFSLKKIGKNVKTLFSNGTFLSASFLLVCIYSVIVIFNIIGPFLIQNILKYSPVDYGHFALFLGFGYFLGNFLNKFLIKYFNPKNIVLFGNFLALLTTMVFFSLSFSFLSIYAILYPIFLIFLFSGFIFPNVMTEVMELYPKIAGTVSAVYGTVLIVGVSIISFIISFIDVKNLIPLGIMYILLMMISFILVLAFRSLMKKRV